MNNIEKWVYNRVRYSPKFKKKLVLFYQLFCSVFVSKKSTSTMPITSREGYFFGFHDKSPWSQDNTKLLAHKFVNPLKAPTSEDKVKIGFFEGDTYEEFTAIAETRTWNWQMGAMLQWIGNQEKFIFNDWDGIKHIARIFNTKGQEIENLNVPIAAVSPEGSYALSLSFNRLRVSDPAYGYAMGDERELKKNRSLNSGIHLINLSTKQVKFLFSIKDIFEYQTLDSMKNAYHYFSHPLFNPPGNRFVFYHRWKMPNNQIWTRMFSADINGQDIHLFQTNGTVTHIAWKDSHSILAYANKEREGDNYYLFQDQSDDFEIIGEEFFASDGHPQFSPSNDTFVTDTYPNRARKQKLIIFDLLNNKGREIAELHSPLKYRGTIRCDLHPRWDRTGKMLSFDSTYTGTRALCTMEINS